MKLRSILTGHYKGIFFVFILNIIENVAWVAEPTIFGKVIDAFIEKASKPNLQYEMKHLVPLLIWAGLYLLNSASGTTRRTLEQSTFQKLYVDIITMISRIGRNKNHLASKTVGRAQMAEEFITFFRYRVPEIVGQAISIGGAIIALSLFDHRIALACLVTGIPLLAISNVYNKRVMKYESELHDGYEVVYEMFTKSSEDEIRTFYAQLGNVQQRIANWGAANFGVMRIILLTIFIFILYIAIDIDDFSTGAIYSIVSYLWSFVGSIEYLPELMESTTSLKEITKRIEVET